LKSTGASYPSKLKIKQSSNDKEKLHFLLFFNKKKSWSWLSESKLRPFCKENDVLFLDKAEKFFSQKFKNEVFKAYKKAEKMQHRKNKINF
jgi:hypothetical protein